jgi:hypothetical protein
MDQIPHFLRKHNDPALEQSRQLRFLAGQYLSMKEKLERRRAAEPLERYYKGWPSPHLVRLMVYFIDRKDQVMQVLHVEKTGLRALQTRPANQYEEVTGQALRALQRESLQSWHDQRVRLLDEALKALKSESASLTRQAGHDADARAQKATIEIWIADYSRLHTKALALARGPEPEREAEGDREPEA